MEDTKWKYRIGSGKMPMILTFIMFVLFGGLALWLHKIQNGVFVLAGMLAAVILILFIATVYRFLFYKVFIGKNGFYYQTGMNNGTYYAYETVEKAWISSGTAQHGAQEEYCVIEIAGGPIIRFQFFYNDKKGIKYLIKHAEDNRSRNDNITSESEEYLIDGKVFGKERIVIAFILTAIIGILDILLIQSNVSIYFYLPETVMGIGLTLYLMIHQRYYKIHIGQQGFYYRTHPFNGQHFDYRDIVECREIKKVIRHRRNYREAGSRSYYFFFEFIDNKGTKRKFQFEKPIHEREVNVLKERIELAKRHM